MRTYLPRLDALYQITSVDLPGAEDKATDREASQLRRPGCDRRAAIVSRSPRGPWSHRMSCPEKPTSGDEEYRYFKAPGTRCRRGSRAPFGWIAETIGGPGRRGRRFQLGGVACVPTRRQRAGGGDKPGLLYLKSSSFRVCTIRFPVTAAASSLYRYTPDANRLPASSRPSHRRVAPAILYGRKLRPVSISGQVPVGLR